MPRVMVVGMTKTKSMAMAKTMGKAKTRSAGAAALMTAAMAGMATMMAGCVIGGNGPLERPRETQTETLKVPREGAKSVHVHLQMAAGQLTISGGAQQLMNGTFEYNVPDWKPDLSYNLSAGDGQLMIMQPDTGHTALGGVTYDWNLHFANDVPLSISAEMGAADSKLDFSGMQLRELELKAGVGNATVDLSGPWKQNFTGTLEGGVGNVDLKLPRDVGVHVTVDGGIGSVSAPGFKKDGDAYENDAYGKGGVTLEIHVSGGVGNVKLEMVGTRSVV